MDLIDLAQEFAGRVVIVTGAAGGIGTVAARRFAQGGASVVLVDRDEAGLDRERQALAADGVPVLAVAANLRDDAAAAAITDRVIAEFGRIDVLHNNAGFFPAAEGRLHEAEFRLWDLTLDVNLRASAALCKEILPHMIRVGGGAIVNTSSAQGTVGDVAWTSYGVAKAGLVSLTQYVATQYGRDGIRCNCIAPGLIATPGALDRLPAAQQATYEAATSLGRLGRPEEIAEAVAFLASDRASFLTGQLLRVDGGLLSHMPSRAPETAAVQTV